MTIDRKPREFWLDLASNYGDPCDFVSEGEPNKDPAATNIHVREVLPEPEFPEEEFKSFLSNLCKAGEYPSPNGNEILIAAWAWKRRGE